MLSKFTISVSFVVALPDEGPKITGGKPRYHIGDEVNVNCTSGTSKPAANLQWFINGEQVIILMLSCLNRIIGVKIT